MTKAVSCESHLERMARDAEEVEERVRAAVVGLTPEQLTWRPPQGGWCVGECLEHISVTNELYCEGTQVVLGGTPKIAAETAPDFKPGPIAARFIRMLEPGKRRYKAPKPFQPDAAGPVGAGAVDRFFEVHTRVGAVIDSMATVDLTRTRVASPVSSFIRFRIGDMMDVMLVHAKRHVLQAERVILHPDFPVSAGSHQAEATEEEE